MSLHLPDICSRGRRSGSSTIRTIRQHDGSRAASSSWTWSAWPSATASWSSRLRLRRRDFDGYKTPSFLSAPGGIDVGVETTTMSKGYNMAGWRLGFCGGNAEMVRALATIKAYYDYGIFRPIQIAAIMALRNAEEAVEAQAAIYQHRRDVLVRRPGAAGLADRPPAGLDVRLGQNPRALGQRDGVVRVRHEAFEGGRRRRQSRRWVRRGRRRLSAAGLGGERAPPAAGRAADRAVFGEVGGGRVHDVVQAGWALSASHARSSMTESDWLRSVHADSMLSFLTGKTSDRKLRLFALRLLLRKWDWITDPRSRAAVATTEHFVDGSVSQRRWLRARSPALNARSSFDRVAQRPA